MSLLLHIKNALGLTKAPQLVGSAPLPQLPLHDQFRRIGGGITPLQVSSILQLADSGYMHDLVDLANDMRQKDAHLQATLQTRETSLTGVHWRLRPGTKPGRDTPTAQAKSQARFVDDALRNAQGLPGNEVRSFTDTISHLSGAVFMSYSVAETEFIKQGMNTVPVGFRCHGQRRFRFSQSDGRLVQWDQTMPRGEGVDLVKKFPGKFIQHQPRVNGDVAAREGLARLLIWPALFRNWAFSDWMKLAELSWKPWRFGVYKRGASTKDIADLEAGLDMLVSNGYMTHSDAVEMNVEWPERGRGARSAHGEMAEFFAGEMSKAILGQTLTTETGERGARSLGEVHDRVRKDIMEADAISLSSTIRRDLVAPIIRANFGPDALIPWFVFVTEDINDLGAMSRSVEGLVRSGLEIGQSWVRDKAGIPDPRENEKILRGKEDITVIAPDTELQEQTKLDVAEMKYGPAGEEDVDLDGLEDDDE